MTTIDRNTPVLVTGATGYVAGWLVKELLDAGHTVHAAVRDPDNAAKLQHLDDLAADAPGAIRYFKANLLTDGAYDEAMAGCQLVFHTASPFTSSVKNPQKELVDPALEGTRNVLESANRTDSMRRVVVTSSCAAIYGDNIDVANAPGGVLTEEVWNTSSSLDHNPYPYSKTVAEHKAWEIAGQQNRWDLVTVNPSLVIGPGLNPHATSESFNIMKSLTGGEMKPGAPLLGLGAIDVRDLALAHYRAGFTPEAQGRYIVSATDTTLLDMANELYPKYGKYPLPRRQLPTWLARLAGPLMGYPRKFVQRNFGYRFHTDNSKARRELAMSFRPLRESLEDFMQQLIDSGQIKAR